VIGLAFPIPAMPRDVGDDGDFAALCRCPSARPHLGGTRFVENKGPTSIRKDCQKAVEAFFSCFSGDESANCQLPFASCSFVKDLMPQGTLHPKAKYRILPFVRLWSQ